MGYKKLFWGFIFLFDFRFNGFDILPDIIAYILFYQGLTILEEKNEFFGIAKKFTIPMIVISIFDIYQPQMNEFGSNSLGVFGILLGIISVVLGLIIIYNICKGIGHEARLINNVELESQSNNRWLLFLINDIFIMIGIILPMGILVIFILIFSLVTYFLMLGLMNTASNILD
ncbi:MAG: hypothetical protein N4A50_10385 [Vallitalea sp.]|jgi:hypothetical protein|nr:hypothetical protein [Vallitalea sp.]